MPLRTYMLCTCLWIIYRMPSFSYEIIFIIKFCEIKMYNSKIVLPSAFSLILLFSLPFTHNQLTIFCFLTFHYPLSRVNVPHFLFGKSCEIVYLLLPLPAATHSPTQKPHHYFEWILVLGFFHFLQSYTLWMYP